MPDWKETLNLPRTGFRMKAGLPATEPDAIARWEREDLYGRIRERRRGAPRYVLHDGPPYANGEIHVGTALNKILKDFIVRARTMAGFDAPYVPGWDCHGLPIELRVDRELGKRKRDMRVADVRRACRRYAERYVDIQRDGFKRLGVLGEWDAPYLTMRYAYQATIVRALGRFVEQNLVYRGKKPVHWCIKCRTALAEAEVEYEPHRSPSIHVEFPLAAESRPALAALAPALADRAAGVLIWTTTPWTIPSNLAIAFHPEVTYAAYETATPAGQAGAVIVAEPLAGRVAGETGRALGSPAGDVPGQGPGGAAVPAPAVRARLGRRAGRLRHARSGHRRRPHRARATEPTTSARGVQYGLDVYAPVGPGGRFADDVERFGGMGVFEANPHVEAALAERGRAVEALRPGALVSPLLALPQAGHLPGHVAVVHRARPRRAAAAGRSTPSPA